ncbi:MAG: hypothetical protein V5786_07930 [Psychromonas sp.]
MDIVNQNSTRLNQVTQDQQTAWQCLVEQARSKIYNADWDGACVFYKQAFVIAEKLMCEQNCAKKCAVNRYLNTAEEFAFVMKKNNFDCALALFFSQIKENLAKQEIKFSHAELTHRLSH